MGWRRCLAESLEYRVPLSATPTSISVAVSAEQAVYGAPVTLTAAITASPTAPSEGTVTFLDDGNVIGTAPVSGGTATLAGVRLNAGNHSIIATYGDPLGNYVGSSTTAGPSSLITTFAGGGGSLGDRGPGTSAQLSYPGKIALDSAGDLFIADTANDRIRRVDHATGIITTVAGTGISGFSGDGGQATAAQICAPYGIAVDAAGDLFIADTGNYRIREVNHTNGIITTVAGDGTLGYGGDNGEATAAELNMPRGLAVDSSGDLFIADGGNNRVREVNLATGIITTVVGNGAPGFTGDNGQAMSAELNDPFGVAVDSAGDLFIADASNDRIREVASASGIITTVAGDGTIGPFGSVGDGSLATAAQLIHPCGIAVDAAGNLFIADSANDRVREVDHSTGIIVTVTGNGQLAYSGDGGQAGLAEVGNPSGVAVDSIGDVFIADTQSCRIREVAGSGAFVVVTPATLTITANDTDNTYGDERPTLSARYSGFVNGESAANLAAQPVLSTTATAASAVGSYAITVSGAADPNYTITYVSGSLTVTPAPLTIAANSAAKAYGAAVPALSASYSGFVNGDSNADLTTQPTLSTTATAASPAGAYAIVVNGAADPNYSINYVSGLLNVLPPPVAAADVYVIGSGTVSVTANQDVLANDTPSGGLAVTAGAVAGETGGTFHFNADGSFTYTPPAQFAGYDRAHYTVADSLGDTSAATVTVLSHEGGVVWKFYESVLGRSPDNAGLGFWINHLAQGGSTGDMAVAFAESDELLNQVIGGYYQQYLGRAADAAGLAAWKSVWRATGGPEIVQAYIAASPEFFASAGGTNAAWLTALYQRVLGRTPDAAGFGYWEQELAAGASKVDVVLDFLKSREAFSGDVTNWFEQDFGVQPTADQLHYFVNEMLSGTSDAAVERQLASSPAYSTNVPSAPPGTAVGLPEFAG